MKNLSLNEGKKSLINKYKKLFHTENFAYYSPEDYKKAERKFVKYALHNGF